jgi:hypothetical protein
MFNDPRGWLSYVTQTIEHSPLYTHLFAGIKDDAKLLELLALMDQDQPNLILFLSVINFLLLSHREDPFTDFYPYFRVPQRPATEAYPFFRQFCLAHEQELRQILPKAILQTNEVTRCANLLPAFALVYQDGQCQPLAGIELGASGGLNLNWDNYSYIYNHAYAIGDERSPVQIHCSFQGRQFPPLPQIIPPMASRVGIELSPLDLTNEQDVKWMRACIWPEEMWRYQHFEAALAYAKQSPPTVLAGDASELLPDLLTTIPPEQTICIWHSFALNQGRAATRERIECCLMNCSRARTIYRVSLEVDPANPAQPLPQLEIHTYRHGERVRSQRLATCALHGERMEWHMSNTRS